MKYTFFAIFGVLLGVVPAMGQQPPGGGPGGGGGNGGNGANGAFVHDDSLIAYAKFGTDQTIAVPQAMEYRGDHPAGTAFTADQCFGAFVVANLNDSDNDGIMDAADCNPNPNGAGVVPVSDPPRDPYGNGFNADINRTAEPDLIKIKIAARKGLVYEGDVLPNEIQIVGNTKIQSNSPNIFFWKDAQKTEPLGGFAAHGSNGSADADGRRTSYIFDTEGNYEFYIEVAAPSNQLEDMVITVTGPTVTTYGDGTPGGPPPKVLSEETPRDRLNITSIWGQEREIIYARNRFFRIGSFGAGEAPGTGKIVFKGMTTIAVPTNTILPKKGEVWVIHDDAHANTGFYQSVGYHPTYDTGRQYWDCKIISSKLLQDGSIEVQVEEPSTSFPTWLNENDSACFALPQETNSGIMRMTNRKFGMPLGSAREMMNHSWGIIVGINALPKGIMRVKMSNGGYPTFDITRQAFNRVRKNSTLTQLVDFPSHNEEANDDPNNSDSDTYVFDNTLNKPFGGGTGTQPPAATGTNPLDFDACYSFDSPGSYGFTVNWPMHYRFSTLDYQEATNRGNYREFLRIDFKSRNLSYGTNANIWPELSRCSPIVKWHSAISRQPDVNKFAGPDSAGSLLYHEKDYIGPGGGSVWKNVVAPGHMNPIYVLDDPNQPNPQPYILQ